MSSLRSLPALALALATTSCALMPKLAPEQTAAEAARERCLAVLARVDSDTEEQRLILQRCMESPMSCLNDRSNSRSYCDDRTSSANRPHHMSAEVALQCDDPDIAGDKGVQASRSAAMARAAHVDGQRVKLDLARHGCDPLPDQSEAPTR